MKGTLNQIDWFRERGFLLGQDKSLDIYYVVDSGTGRRYDFNFLRDAQRYVEGVESERLLAKCPLLKACGLDIKKR